MKNIIIDENGNRIIVCPTCGYKAYMDFDEFSSQYDCCIFCVSEMDLVDDDDEDNYDEDKMKGIY